MKQGKARRSFRLMAGFLFILGAYAFVDFVTKIPRGAMTDRDWVFLPFFLGGLVMLYRICIYGRK